MKSSIKLILLIAVLIFKVQLVQAQTYQPWHYYTFDQANPLADSMARNNLNPTYYSCNYSIENKTGSSGVSKYVNFPLVSGAIIGPTAAVDTAFTFECLLRPGYDFQTSEIFSSTNNCAMVRMGYSYFLFTTTHLTPAGVTIKDEFFIDLYGTGRKSYGYYIDGNWHHFVFKVNVKQGIKEVWIDGELPVGFSKTFTPGNFQGTGNNIWLNTVNSPKHIRGGMDEIAIYKYDLHPNMIYKHYQNFMNGQHYSFTFTNTPPPTASPVSAGIDSLEYAPGHPNPTVTAVDQLKGYPAPRFKPGNTLLRNLSIYSYSFFGGRFQSGVSDNQARFNSLEIQSQLLKNFNYGITIENSKDYPNFADTASFSGSCIKLANQNPTIPTIVLTYWSGLRPLDANKASTTNYVACSCLPSNNYLQNASGQFIDIYGNVSAKKTLSPDTPLDSVRNDGQTQRFYLDKLLLKLTRPLNFIFENGELVPYPLLSTNGPTLDPSVVADKNATGLDWYTYYGRRFSGILKSYRNEFMSLPGLANTKFTYYEIDGNNSVYCQKYSEMRDVNTWINGQHYGSGEVYPRYPYNWRTVSSAWHGWKWVAESRTNELAAGDKLFSPTISPGWDYNEEINIRPAQWLGFLKALSMVGAEFFYVGYFIEQQPWQKPENYAWQISTPAYAQAITSRYEDFLRNGTLLTGNVPMDPLVPNGTPSYSFNVGYSDLRKLVVARKHNTINKYAITATIQPLSNMIGSTELASTAQFTMDGNTLKINVRRQGSTYIYDKSNPTQPVFYQLDEWHEPTHPSYWSKDFVFEGELFDNTNSNLQIKTSVPAGTVAGDYTSFTSYISFNTATSASFDFAVRGNTPSTYYLWVRARSADGTSTGFTSLMDGANSNQINCITDTNWVWYRINNSNAQAITFSNLSVNNHSLQITSSNGKLLVDKIILTKQSGAVYGNTITNCSGATASITASGSTTFCNGDSVILTANSGSSYLWSTGAVTNSIKVKNAGVYTVTVTTSGVAAVSQPVTVVVNSKPTAVISCNQSFGLCTGGSLTLSGSGGSSYIWTPGGQTTSSKVISAIGIYTLTVTNSNGCTSSISAEITNGNCAPGCTVPTGLSTTNIGSTTAKLNWGAVNGVYQYYYTVKNKSTGVTTGGYVSSSALNITVNNLLAATSYSWRVRTFCTSTTKSSFSISKSFTTNAQRLADENPEETEIDNSTTVLIYPNPSDDIVHIVNMSLQSGEEECSIELFDATGKLLLRKQYLFSENNLEMSLDVSGFAKGIYVCKVISQQSSSFKKLIIN